MPELPEVETVKRVLETIVIGRKITNIEILRKSNVHSDPTIFVNSLKGESFLKMSRIGKFLIFHLTNYKVIISHLRMEGKYYEVLESEPNTKYSRVAIHLDNNHKLCYDDSRCFGFLKLSDESSYLKDKEIAKLGPEPWDANIKVIMKKVKKSSLPIKTSLLNQKLMTGLGNIYVDETLYACKIHPLTPTNIISEKQWENIKKEASRILKEAIVSGGSTIKSYHPGKDIDGNFQTKLMIYGKKGEECPICHSLYRFIKVNGRGTTFCPKCQPLFNKQIKVAIFGKVASGKSEVLSCFEKKLSSDQVVSDLYKRKDVINNVNKEFGLPQNDYVDKKALREILSKDPKAVKRINNLIHPLVKEEIMKFFKENNKGVVAVEVPLLFESKMDSLFDVLIAVESPKAKQQQFLKEREGSKASELAKINSYSTYEKNKNKAEFIIINDSDLNSLKNKTNKIINILKARLS